MFGRTCFDGQKDGMYWGLSPLLHLVASLVHYKLNYIAWRQQSLCSLHLFTCASVYLLFSLSTSWLLGLSTCGKLRNCHSLMLFYLTAVSLYSTSVWKCSALKIECCFIDSVMKSWLSRVNPDGLGLKCTSGLILSSLLLYKWSEFL